MAEKNIDITKGDTKIYDLTFKDKNDNAVDITGATVYFTVKENLTDADVDAKIQKIVTSHTTPTAGETQVTIDPSDTSSLDLGEYYYDIELKTSSDAVYTPQKGKFTITYQVTIT